MNPLSDAVPSKGWLASRAHRRLLVIASYVSFVGGFLLVGADSFVFDVFDVLGDFGRRMISEESLAGMVLCLLLFLPSSVAAWIEPDPP
ncbi:MAG TPA: hypothetical protein VNJ70_11615 [Thermoanaerobaculia bacterium]|nr:hypothetical protein [Thermoanaerobaculia bacterium]